jgi:hypothetical protein
VGKIIQLKVTLKRSRPPIWRRIQVPYDSTFEDLHEDIQLAMGWHNYHMHSFSFRDNYSGQNLIIGPADDDEADHKERRELLKEWFPRLGKKCEYTYDFGDDWEHTILFEDILPAGSGIKYPLCVAGKRACPPEDSGGTWGYEDMLETIKDPKNEQYEEILEWLGADFDPDRFKLEECHLNK